VSIEGLFVVYPFGVVRLSTVIVTAVVLAVVTWRTRRPLLAVLAVLGWLSAFEIAWELSRVAFRQDSLRNALWFSLAVAGWVVAAELARIRPEPRLAGLFALTFVLWLATGFGLNWLGQPVSVRDELLNEVSKTALGAAYLVGALRARSASSGSVQS
jgi:hypothetical protein